MSTATAPRLLDEASLRTTTYRGDVPIVMADGQTWHLPRPLVEFSPEPTPEGGWSFGPRGVNFGAAYLDKLEAVHAAEGGVEEANAVLILAVDLIRRNYALADADIRPLLAFRPDDEANAEMWRLILEVAAGTGPKTSPAT